MLPAGSRRGQRTAEAPETAGRSLRRRAGALEKSKLQERQGRVRRASAEPVPRAPWPGGAAAPACALRTWTARRAQCSRAPGLWEALSPGCFVTHLFNKTGLCPGSLRRGGPSGTRSGRPMGSGLTSRSWRFPPSRCGAERACPLPWTRAPRAARDKSQRPLGPRGPRVNTVTRVRGLR